MNNYSHAHMLMRNRVATSILYRAGIKQYDNVTTYDYYHSLLESVLMQAYVKV